MNIEKLQQEILHTIEGLRELGANIDLEEFELLSAAADEDEEALNVLLNTVQQMRGEHEMRNKSAKRKASKEKDEEPPPPDLDDEGTEPDEADDDEADDVEPKKPVSTKFKPKISQKLKERLKLKAEEANNDKDRLIDDGDDTDYDLREAAMPLSVNSKLATNVKIVATEDVEDYYALLLKLRRKIDALEEFKDDKDPLILKLLKQTYKAYESALDHLEDLAEKSFPAKLDRFGAAAKKTLIEELIEVDEDDKKRYRFDAKGASFSRFVRIEDASVVYSYVLHLRKVEDDEGYVFPHYIVVVSQKMILTEEDQERGVPPKPRFFVTRLLREAHDYHSGHEVKTTAELQLRIKKMLAFDSLRTDIEKINIPFTTKELSNKFVADKVRKVSVDDENHKIVVTFEKSTTTDDINLLIPDFMKNLGAIVNLRKLAIKYHINSTVPSVEFVIIHKTKDKGIINRSQLNDMRERYELSDEAFRSLVKALTIGN